MFNNLDKLPEGQLGIKLMWQVADELSYTHTPAHKNCLLIMKRYGVKRLNQSQDVPKSIAFNRLITFLKTYTWLKFQRYREHNVYEPPLQIISLQVNTDLNALALVLQWYEQLEHLPIPKQVWLQCQLALAEGFTNAVRHAHKGMPLETPIELEVRVFNESLEMRIWDSGKPFDLKAKLRKILTDRSTFRMNMTQNGHQSQFISNWLEEPS